MAKRKKSRKSSKCPEPFNSLIDLAGGIAMNAIADSMEKKHKYHQRGAPNPYRASAIGIATGHMKTTEDIIRLGGAMGAMGAFDDDTVSPQAYQPTESWEFDDIGSVYMKSDGNRYAWRLNCEDGSEYGISPEDYETREEYNAALHEAKAGCTEAEESDKSTGFDSVDTSVASNAEIEDIQEYIYCRVSRLDNGSNEYYLSADAEVRIGSIVAVPTQSGSAQAVVLSVERHTRLTAPKPPEETELLIAD